jgi:GTP-binding protein HflX
MRDEHKAEVEKVLGELDVQGKPRLEILNKADLLTAEETFAAAAQAGAGGAILVSAKDGTGIDALMERIDLELMKDPVIEGHFQIPQSEGTVLAALEAGAVIRDRAYEGNLVRMTIAGPASLLGRYRRFRKVAGGKAPGK